MNKTKKVTVSDTDQLKMRVIALKQKFPKNKRLDYCPIYEYEFGPQSQDQLNKIRAVWNLREADEEITSNLEKIAEKLAA